MQKIEITHYGLDYATVNINGAEFETSIELAKALETALELDDESEEEE